MNRFNFPLMKNNITKRDKSSLIKYLKTTENFTQGKLVKKFENYWSKWLGVKYSVFVNSGSSANLLSLQLLKLKYPKGGKVIVPTLTWSSDIASIIHSGFEPVFVDINLENLGMNIDQIISKIDKDTKAVFISYILGFNCINNKLLHYLKRKNLFIEDVCESHGAKYNNKKLGTLGWSSNFSFYYAHHMSTIEGGMISTNSKDNYYKLLMLRSHGLIREVKDIEFQKKFIKKNKFINSQFIFEIPGFNLRNTEIGACLGLSQLKRLDKNIKIRNKNFIKFLSLLDKNYFFTDYFIKGMSNYAFNVILKKKNSKLFFKILKQLDKYKIEYRLGSAGGGNQLRQPYVRKMKLKNKLTKFPNVEHVHKYCFYIGNYPDLKTKDIIKICKIINDSVKI